MEPDSDRHKPVVEVVESTKMPKQDVVETPTSDLKPKRKKRRWLKVLGGIGLALVILAAAAWYFKWYQPLLDQYNASTVTIKVKEGDTYVIEGAVVKVDGKQLTTDTNGKVTLSNIVAGTYTATITKDGYTDATQTLTLHRGDNDPVYVAMTKLPPKVYAVKGFVQDYVSGQPIANVQVTLASKTVTTDPSGAYTFEKVAPADIKLTLSKSGYLDKEQDITVSNADITTPKIPLVPTGSVIFVSNRDGKRSLYASNYDGSNQHLFVEAKNGVENFSASLSPDASTVLFTSTEDKIQSSYGTDLGKLYIATVDGKNVRKVNDDLALDFGPIWSPNGKYVFFNGYTNAQMNQSVYRVYDVAKSSVIDIGEAAYGITFSPDSSTIAYYVNGSEDRPTTTTQPDGSVTTTSTKVYLTMLKTLNMVTGERKTLAKREQGISSIAFGSDSKTVSYEVVIDGNRHRFEVSMGDGTEKEVAVTNPSTRVYYPSPDGNSKAFMEERDGKKDVFVVDKNGNNEKRLTSLGVVVDQHALVWDDGSDYLTFAVHREGEDALYVVSLNGGDPKKIADYYSDSQRGYY